MRKLISIAFAAAILISCNKLDFPGMVAATSPTVNTRFGESLKLNPDGFRGRIESSSDEYCIFTLADTHIDGTTDHLDKFCSDFLYSGEEATAILHLGDLSGRKGQHRLIADHLSSIKDRMFTTAGNHDLFWGEWDNFLKYFGSSSYLLEISTPSGFKDLFIALDTAGNDVGKDQMDWLEETVFGKITKNENYRNIIVFTHCCIFVQGSALNLTSTIPMDQIFRIAKLFADNSVDLVIAGHHHIHEEDSFKGVDYIILDSMEDRNSNASYSIFHIGDKIEEEIVRL